MLVPVRCLLVDGPYEQYLYGELGQHGKERDRSENRLDPALADQGQRRQGGEELPGFHNGAGWAVIVVEGLLALTNTSPGSSAFLLHCRKCENEMPVPSPISERFANRVILNNMYASFLLGAVR